MTLLHHAGVRVADMDVSLPFYRDGIGLDVIVDTVLETDLEPPRVPLSIGKKPDRTSASADLESCRRRSLRSREPPGM